MAQIFIGLRQINEYKKQRRLNSNVNWVKDKKFSELKKVITWETKRCPLVTVYVAFGPYSAKFSKFNRELCEGVLKSKTPIK